MRKEDKNIVIGQISDKLSEYAHFYLVDLTALDAAATSELRRKCFEQNITLMVVKNKLLQKALDASETDFSSLYATLKGTTAVMFCNTANVPAKLLKKYAIKSKNEVIADIVALLQSPAKNVISALQSGGNTIHGVLKTLGERPE